MVVFPHNAFPTTNNLFLLGYLIANQIPGAPIFPENVPYQEKQSISIGSTVQTLNLN
jgi:hypothetical protein